MQEFCNEYYSDTTFFFFFVIVTKSNRNNSITRNQRKIISFPINLTKHFR